jgi:hypothetical protein
LGPATRRARLPGQAPEPFCERCGASVDVAAIGPWVGMCHCPACDIFACRWCWSEAGEGCPDCGAVFAAAPVGAVAATAGAVAAGAVTTGAIRAGAAVAERQPHVAGATPGDGAAEAVPAAMAALAARHAVDATGTEPQAIRPWQSPRVPAGIGVVALLFVAFAVLLGDPFRPATDTALTPTSSPSTRATGAVAAATTETPDSDPTSAEPPTTDPTIAATDAPPKPAGQASTSGPGSTPLAPTGRTATPRPTQPAATPRPTARPTAAPTPKPVKTPSPTAAPTPQPTPSCRDVPNLVGLTVAKARTTWTGAGFTGGFRTDPDHATGKTPVVGQNQSPGACLPPATAITVTV